MSEVTVQKSQKSQMEERIALLDSYEQSIGLPVNIPPGEENELQSYLNLNRTCIEALDPTSASSIAIRLAQFAFYFQRAINREKANKTWAKEQLNYIVAPELNQLSQYTPNKLELICRENRAADELRRIAVYAQQRIDRLEEISSGLRNIGYVLGLLCKSKLGEKYNG